MNCMLQVEQGVGLDFGIANFCKLDLINDWLFNARITWYRYLDNSTWMCLF